MHYDYIVYGGYVRSQSDGQTHYVTAKRVAQPTIDRINDRAKAIAKKYNKRPQLVSFAALMR